MMKHKKLTGALLAVGLILCSLESVPAASANGKALSAYKKFLAGHVSTYVENVGDWNGNAGEDEENEAAFMVADLDGDHVKELITSHSTGYKTGMVHVYKYQKGKVKRIKSIDVSCNAAGRYNIYVCKKNHLHADWDDFSTGSLIHTAYFVKKGKLKEYACGEKDNMMRSEKYSVKGKKATEAKYKKAVKKCKEAAHFSANTKKNRDKKL